MNAILEDILLGITIGRPSIYENMAVLPIFSEEEIGLSYLTLDDALEQKKIEFEEVSESGRVNSIKAKNVGDEMVLILDGEELIGAKQNRIIHVSTLIPKKTTVEIPVSCVEAHRWSYHGRHLKSRKGVAYSRLRRVYHNDILASLKSKGRFETNQRKVWETIHSDAVASAACSPTMAMSNVYDQTSHTWQEYVANFNYFKDQTGFLVIINGMVEGVEVFGKSATLKRIFKKLMKSYAFSAMCEGKSNKEYKIPTEEAPAFIEKMKSSELRTRPSVGLGEDVRFEEEELIGSALVFNGKPLHVCSFRKSTDAES